MTFMNFCTFWRLIFTKLTKLLAPIMAKLAVFALLESQKLISRKIWVIEKASSWLEWIHCMKYFMGNLFFCQIHLNTVTVLEHACTGFFSTDHNSMQKSLFTLFAVCLHYLALLQCCQFLCTNFFHLATLEFVVKTKFGLISQIEKWWFQSWRPSNQKNLLIDSKFFSAFFPQSFSQLLFCTPFQYKDISSNW